MKMYRKYYLMKMKKVFMGITILLLMVMIPFIATKISIALDVEPEEDIQKVILSGNKTAFKARFAKRIDSVRNQINEEIEGIKEYIVQTETARK